MSIIALLLNDLCLPEARFVEIEQTVDQMYGRARVGRKIIHAPKQELKLIQCWISDFIKSTDCDLPEFITAYEKKCSILRNASTHVGNRHLLNLDIHSFFPSITSEKIASFLEQMHFFDPAQGAYRNLTNDEVSRLRNLLLFKESLTMGSPSSPALANRIMLPIDFEILGQLPAKYSYSRYSDDISISSQSWIPEEITAVVETVLNKHGFTLNHSKTNFMGGRDRKQITGIVITPDHKISIGRKRKSRLKKEIYEFMIKGTGEPEKILGFIFFCKSIDPDYVSKVLAKYSNYNGDVMQKLYACM